MNARTIGLARAICIAALVVITIYAFARLYLFSQRVDTSILILNVVLFAAIAGVLVYLSRKERELEEREMFRD